MSGENFRQYKAWTSTSATALRMHRRLLQAALLLLPATAACGQPAAQQGAKAPTATGEPPFTTTIAGDFEQPWAMDFLPGSTWAAVTEKKGAIKLWNSKGQAPLIDVSGVPTVSFGGQGGLGDILFEPGGGAGGRYPFYLSWIEAGEGETRGAVVGRGVMQVTGNRASISGMNVIWRQAPKVTGGGHFSHRLAISPDGQYLYVTSGDRQKMAPAQDDDGLLGKVLRLTREGNPAPGNPMAAKGGLAAQFWTIGHRNLLGIDFAADGRLWVSEMGPKGGDELNLIVAGRNYGWPNASNGSHYDDGEIPNHTAGDGYEGPKVNWTPSISPGGLMIYSGNKFARWTGDALIPALSGKAIIHVDLDGDRVAGQTSYPMNARIREIEEGPDGTIYALEDERNGSQGRLLRLEPAR